MQIGSDRLHFHRGHAFIHAARPMDWPIREFSRTPIMVLGAKYFLSRKSPRQVHGCTIYELSPWPAECHDPSPAPIIYDENYVRERDEGVRATRRSTLLGQALYPLYPFLGLLWSHFKDRWLVRIGFEPSSITRASVVMLFLLSVGEGVFVGWLAGGILAWLLGWPRVVDWAVLIVLATDCTIRFSRSLELDQTQQLGFLEWLWRPSA